MTLLFFLLSGSFSFLINPKPPHCGQISVSSESLSNLPLPSHSRQNSIPYLSGSKLSSMSIVKFSGFNGSCQRTASGIQFFYFLLLFSCLAGRLPIFEDEMVDDFSAIDALPSEEMFLMTIKLLPDHSASASITFHQKFLFWLIPFFAVILFPLLLISSRSPRKTVSQSNGERSTAQFPVGREKE